MDNPQHKRTDAGQVPYVTDSPVASANRKIRLILGGVLVLSVIALIAYLSRTVTSIPKPSGINIAILDYTPDMNEIVATLFAQTAIAQVNVSVTNNNNVQVNVTLPVTVAPDSPVFPEARANQMLADLILSYRQSSYNNLQVPGQASIVAHYFGNKPHANYFNYNVDEVWCIQVTPFAVAEVLGQNTITYDRLALKRKGGTWELIPTDQGKASWNVSTDSASWSDYGCIEN